METLEEDRPGRPSSPIELRMMTNLKVFSDSMMNHSLLVLKNPLDYSSVTKNFVLLSLQTYRDEFKVLGLSCVWPQQKKVVEDLEERIANIEILLLTEV